MSFSQGIAPFYDLFSNPDDPPDEAAVFLDGMFPKSARILDIGAGTGATAVYLARRGHYVTALEPDPEMYGVLLARLATDHAARLVTPLPIALVEYVAAQAAQGSHIVLDIPVETPFRAERPWSLLRARQLGELRVEHHATMRALDGGRWSTEWSFRCVYGKQCVLEVNRAFDWAPLSQARSEALLATHGLQVVSEYASYDRSPYVAGKSKSRLVVGSAALRLPNDRS